MEENQRAALIRLLKIGEGMVNPMKIEDFAEQQHNNEQMLLALLDLLDAFMIEPNVREVIDLVIEAKKVCMEENETLGEGYRKLQRDIDLFSMYKRLGRLISRIEAAQGPNLVNHLRGIEIDENELTVVFLVSGTISVTIPDANTCNDINEAMETAKRELDKCEALENLVLNYRVIGGAPVIEEKEE